MRQREVILKAPRPGAMRLILLLVVGIGWWGLGAPGLSAWPTTQRPPAVAAVTPVPQADATVAPQASPPGTGAPVDPPAPAAAPPIEATALVLPTVTPHAVPTVALEPSDAEARWLIEAYRKAAYALYDDHTSAAVAALWNVADVQAVVSVTARAADLETKGLREVLAGIDIDFHGFIRDREPYALTQEALHVQRLTAYGASTSLLRTESVAYTFGLKAGRWVVTRADVTASAEMVDAPASTVAAPQEPL